MEADEELDGGFEIGVISSVISPLPPPPTSKEPENFDERADEFLESLPRFGEEINSVGSQINEFYKAFFPMAENEGEKIKEGLIKEAQKVVERLEELKEDAKKEIASVITANKGNLKERLKSVYSLSLSAREVVIRNRKNFEKVGEVIEFRGIKVPKGYVALPAKLKIQAYPLLYKALKNQLKSIDGEFEIFGGEKQIIYTGKGE